MPLAEVGTKSLQAWSSTGTAASRVARQEARSPSRSGNPPAKTIEARWVSVFQVQPLRELRLHPRNHRRFSLWLLAQQGDQVVYHTDLPIDDKELLLNDLQQR